MTAETKVEEIKKIAKHEYVLTIRLRVSEVDDVAAREKAIRLLERTQWNEKDWVGDVAMGVKLQEIFKDKPPRKVEL
jgi:hypothetical protein